MSLENFDMNAAGGENGPEMLPEIEAAESFDDLYAALDKLGSVRGSSREYSADELKDRISKAESAPFFLDMVTRTGGLRDKVKELLDKKSEQ